MKYNSSLFNHLPVVLENDNKIKENCFLILEVENLEDYMVNIHIIFKSKYAEVKVIVGIFPKWSTTLPIPVNIINGNSLFLKRTPGRFKTVVEGGNMTIDELKEIIITAPENALESLKLSEIFIKDTMPKYFNIPSKPIVDSLHQWNFKNWPGKSKSVKEVKKRLLDIINNDLQSLPHNWSVYGGYKNKKFKKSGFFRTEFDGIRWWFVDPEGFAFWSVGPNCVRSSSIANITGIIDIFEHKEDVLNSKIETEEGELYIDGLRNNLELSLGEDWYIKWKIVTKKLLNNCYFNTIGNWSDPEFIKTADIPYVLTMKDFPTTMLKIFRDFPDVYSEEYHNSSKIFSEQLAEHKDSKYMIGYFMANEPQWGFYKDFNIGLQVLLTKNLTQTRKEFINYLQSKYNDINNLNCAWNTSFKSWNSFINPINLREIPKSESDSINFTKMAIREYIRVPSEKCRKVDKNHLNLGVRWAFLHSEYQLEGSEYLDVFSINYYKLKPDSHEVSMISCKTKKPILIGEFHFGSLDKGLPGTGIKAMSTTKESAQAYEYYIENSVAHPCIIGAHYFQWVDQHILGRFDGENMQIGIVDITNNPYKERVESCQKVHSLLYEIAIGQRNVSTKKPKDIVEGTLVW